MSDIGDKLDGGFARRSRQFVLALHTEYHSTVFSVYVAIRYGLNAGDFAGAYGALRNIENFFQMAEELGTSFLFGLVKQGHRVCESVDFSPQFVFTDILLSRNFHSATDVAEVTKGLEKERNGGYEIVFFGAVVQDSPFGVLLSLRIIFELGGHRRSLLSYVQVTKPIQDTGGNRRRLGLDRDPWEWTQNLIRSGITANLPKTMISAWPTLQSDNLFRGRSTEQLPSEKDSFSNFKLFNSFGCLS